MTTDTMVQDMAAIVAHHLQRAERHFRDGAFDAAATALESVIAIDPEHGDALDGLAYMSLRRGDFVAAADYFDRVFSQSQTDAARLGDAAQANVAAGRFRRAAELFEAALGRAQATPEMLLATAICYERLGEFDLGQARLQQALALRPNAWELHYNLGRLQGSAGLYDAELASYQKALTLNPRAVPVLINLGVAYRERHEFDHALLQFKRAVQIDSGNAGARTNRAQTNLLLGHYPLGFNEYEWRWRDGGQQRAFIASNSTSNATSNWRSLQELKGKVLLLYAEQGFGDTLQFVRYVQPLAAVAAHIVLRVQESLVSLLDAQPSFGGNVTVVSEEQAIPDHDIHCPLMSVPFAMGGDPFALTTMSPYVNVPETRAAAFADLALPPRLTVGVAWSGRPTHPNDRHRSTALAAWEPLFETPDTAFVSLQKEMRGDDRREWDAMDVHTRPLDLASHLGDFADTAALIARLDLVICVDTAVAHLAAALGKPVWVVLPYTPDWRWGIAGTGCPWYPSVRLFRQTSQGNWNEVFLEVQRALAALAKTGQ